MRLGTITISILALGLSAWFVVQAFEFPGPSTLGEPGGARIPILFGTFAVLLSVSLVIREAVHGAAEVVQYANTGRLIVFCLASIGYVIAIETFGYYLATGLFLALVILLLGSPLRWTLPVAAGFVGFVYLVFHKLLGVPLP